MLNIEPPPGGTTKPFAPISSPSMFVTIATAFGLRSNQSRRVPDATDQRGRPARVVLGGPKPRCGEATAAPRELSELPGVLHCCSVDPEL